VARTSDASESPPFDPLSLSTADLSLFILCRTLSESPIAPAPSVVRHVQDAFRSGDAAASIRAMDDLLTAANLLPDGPVDVDPTRFAQIRILRRRTQQELASAIGVKPAVVSHLEKGRNSLALERLLLAAALLEVPLAQLLKRSPTKGPRAADPRPR
jgi:DNA-binding XRE family transcriptional regulator